MKTGTAWNIAGVIALGGAVVGGLFLFGVFKQWEGSYSGIVRRDGGATPSPGAITVLKKGSGTVVVLSIPDVGAECALDFRREMWRQVLDGYGQQKCSGRTTLIFPEGDLDLDGDNVHMKLRVYRDGNIDDTVAIEFIGTRGSTKRASFPAFLTAATSAASAPSAKAQDSFDCYSACMTCDTRCLIKGNDAGGTRCSADCYRTSAECCKNGGVAADPDGKCGCSDGKPPSAAAAPPSNASPTPRGETAPAPRAVPNQSSKPDITNPFE